MHFVEIDHATRRKMDGALFSEETWSHKLFNWTVGVNENNSAAYYGMIAFGISPDGKYFDAMHVVYRIDFKLLPRQIITQNKHSILHVFGLVSWTTTSEHMQPAKISTHTVKLLENFFRFKAMEGFYKEGIIDSINYVNQIDEIA